MDAPVIPTVPAKQTAAAAAPVPVPAPALVGQRLDAVLTSPVEASNSLRAYQT
jgi:hypothetical protein